MKVLNSQRNYYTYMTIFIKIFSLSTRPLLFQDTNKDL